MQLRQSKTDRFGHSVMLVIGPTGTSTCPVAAMRAFLRKRTTHATDLCCVSVWMLSYTPEGVLHAPSSPPFCWC